MSISFSLLESSFANTLREKEVITTQVGFSQDDNDLKNNKLCLDKFLTINNCEEKNLIFCSKFKKTREDLADFFGNDLLPNSESNATQISCYQLKEYIKKWGKPSKLSPRISQEIEINQAIKTLRINILLDDNLSNENLERAFIRAILAFYIINKAPKNQSENIRIADWVVEGLRLAIKKKFSWSEKVSGVHDSDLKKLSKFLRTMSLNDLLGESPFEAINKRERKIMHISSLDSQLFSSASYLLIKTMTGLPNGKANTLRFIASTSLDSSSYVFDNEKIKKHFPGLEKGDKSLEKWFLLELEYQKKQSRLSMKSPWESSSALDKALKLIIEQDDKQILIEADKLDNLKDIRIVRKAANLMHINIVNIWHYLFPDYKQLASKYEEVFRQLLLSSDKNISSKIRSQLAKLKKERRELGIRFAKIEDEWRNFLAKVPSESSFSVEDYRNTAFEFSGKIQESFENKDKDIFDKAFEEFLIIQNVK